MKKNIAVKKLVIHRETVRLLSTKQLGRVAGGAPSTDPMCGGSDDTDCASCDTTGGQRY